MTWLECILQGFVFVNLSDLCFFCCFFVWPDLVCRVLFCCACVCACACRVVVVVVGRISLGGALLLNQHLLCLDLGGNRIGDIGASSLNDMLHVNTALTLLDVKNNRIGDKGYVNVRHVIG